MGNATIWETEKLPGVVGVQAWTLAREATLENRLDSLKEVALTLLHEVESLRSAAVPSHDNPRLLEAVRHFETQLIWAALDKTRGNQSRAAKLLGVKHTTLNAKMKRYGIRWERVQTSDGISDQEIAA
jgi:transcriptional regulator with GAF, ATPase, and Fis domain